MTSDVGVVFVGAGDIASCDYDRDELTARILDTIPGTVFTLGDNVYYNGSAAEYAGCYAPTWGRHKDRTRPTPGNHDYHSTEAAPYYQYFGERAGLPGLGYYSYELGDWHIVALNSSISMKSGSAQERWLRADLAGRANQCVLAYWHKPRFTSGHHGNAPGTTPLWQALYDAGAEIVLSGHDHDYERFAPQTPDGTLDAERGIREFVVGTGGTELRALEEPIANSEARNDHTHGVLKLTLYGSRYEWQFIPIDGQPYTDAGSGVCHDGSSPASGTIGVRIATSSDDAEESGTGEMYLGSADLELVYDLGTNQTVGLRFAGVAIPPRAAITSAHVQFQADETNTAPADLTIAGEASDHPKAFTYEIGNLSARPRTDAAVTWAPPGWSTVGEAGPAQRTPNLAAVLQEIVNRPGWMSGNALALMVTGTGKRTAAAFNLAATAAPVLHVEFQTVDAYRSTVIATGGTMPADGTSRATITVTLLDGDGAPVVGHTVMLAQTGTSVISGPSGPSDANGQVTFTVTNAAPEVVTYSATDVLTGVTITQTAQVTFKHTLDADRSTVTTNVGMVPADGTSGATITVTLLHGDGAPAVGHNVILAQTGTSVISGPSGLSNADGQVTFTVTNAAPEVVTYSATDVPTGITITQTAQVAFKARTVLDVRVAASADDAEESATGSMSIGSTDLELVFDLGTNQTVGLRFAGVAIPQGAAITNAYVQFQTDETSLATTDLTIVGQVSDNAMPFTYLVAKISPRPRTAAAVAWAPPGWSILDEAGPAQRTPDLAAVLQEIVNRPGWASGNSLVLIITGTGKRVANAFDGVPAAAPLLHVEFIN